MKRFVKLSAVAITTLMALALGGCQSNGQQVFDDDFLSSVMGDSEPTELTIQIKQALKRNGQTALHNIDVVLLSEGSVKLIGTVSDSATMAEAERVAYSIDGVRIVANGLYVR